MISTRRFLTMMETHAITSIVASRLTKPSVITVTNTRHAEDTPSTMANGGALKLAPWSDPETLPTSFTRKSLQKPAELPSGKSPQSRTLTKSVMVRIVDVVIFKSLMETVTQIQTVEEGSNVVITIVGEAKDLPSIKPMTAATTLRSLRNPKDLTVARLDLLQK